MDLTHRHRWPLGKVRPDMFFCDRDKRSAELVRRLGDDRRRCGLSQWPVAASSALCAFALGSGLALAAAGGRGPDDCSETRVRVRLENDGPTFSIPLSGPFSVIPTTDEADRLKAKHLGFKASHDRLKVCARAKAGDPIEAREIYFGFDVWFFQSDEDTKKKNKDEFCNPDFIATNLPWMAALCAPNLKWSDTKIPNQIVIRKAMPNIVDGKIRKSLDFYMKALKFGASPKVEGVSDDDVLGSMTLYQGSGPRSKYYVNNVGYNVGFNNEPLTVYCYGLPEIYPGSGCDVAYFRSDLLNINYKFWQKDYSPRNFVLIDTTVNIIIGSMIEK